MAKVYQLVRAMLDCSHHNKHTEPPALSAASSTHTLQPASISYPPSMAGWRHWKFTHKNQAHKETLSWKEKKKDTDR